VTEPIEPYPAAKESREAGRRHGRLTVALLLLGGAAWADTSLPGTYDVKLDELGTSCSPPPVSMGKTTVRIDVRQQSLTVNIPTIPQMVGVAPKDTKVSAKTVKVLPTTVTGLDGSYQIAGSVGSDGTVDLVLEADYSVKGKPYCTQSWKVQGKRH
jgi:hypothetical protein